MLGNLDEMVAAHKVEPYSRDTSLKFRPLMSVRPRCGDDESLTFVLLLRFPDGSWLVIKQSYLTAAIRGALAFRKSDIEELYVPADEQPVLGGGIPAELCFGVS